MKKLLLITGDLATGKTTLAKALSERYNVPMFFKDLVKEMLGDTIGFSDRRENKRLSVAAGELLHLIFAEFARRGEALILESNFRSAELEKLHKTASDSGYDVLTLVLRGDVRVLHARFLNRLENENRHPAHFSLMLKDFSDFEMYINELRAEEIPGRSLNIDAGDFSYLNDGELLTLIDGFMRG